MAHAAASGLRAGHIDLAAHMNASGVTTALDPNASCLTLALEGASLFDPAQQEAQQEEHGWKALADVLQKLTPSVNTDVPLTSPQITARISGMLDKNQTQQALAIIEKRLAQEQVAHRPGTNVQLMFLHARALADLGRDTEAIALYKRMTTLYPELPEPWNNLANEYVKQGKLSMAQDALKMALTADPKYTVARDNLGRVQLMLASQTLHRASHGDKAAEQ